MEIPAMKQDKIDGIISQLGLDNILIVCVNGLKGFPEAIEAVYQEWLQYWEIAEMWRRNWGRIAAMFSDEGEIRRVNLYDQRH